MPTKHTRRRTLARGSRLPAAWRPRRQGPEISSASTFLQGFVVDNRPLKQITKGKGGVRYLEFRGGGRTTVDRAFVHELAKLKGTVEYRAKLLAAKTPAERRHRIRVSRNRQQAILMGYVGRLRHGASTAPAHIRERLIRQATRLLRGRHRFGSPILGETPATSVVPPSHGPAKTFSTIARTAVKFRTITRRGKHYVIPMP